MATLALTCENSTPAEAVAAAPAARFRIESVDFLRGVRKGPKSVRLLTCLPTPATLTAMLYYLHLLLLGPFSRRYRQSVTMIPCLDLIGSRRLGLFCDGRKVALGKCLHDQGSRSRQLVPSPFREITRNCRESCTMSSGLSATSQMWNCRLTPTMCGTTEPCFISLPRRSSVPHTLAKWHAWLSRAAMYSSVRLAPKAQRNAVVSK